MSRRLLEPILDDGIRHANYSNGIVLTAEALAADQTANRRQHRRLASALGSGVVHGLEVEVVNPGSATTLPELTITGGLALNANGDALALHPTSIRLTPDLVEPQIPQDVGLFADCGQPQTSTRTTGAFILALSPVSLFEGAIPVAGLNDDQKAAGCAKRYAAEGVRFKLAALPVPDDLASAPDRLRNRLAHHCFGTATLLAADDPFGAPSAYGAIDALRSATGDPLDLLRTGTEDRLTACDVPLALLFWPATGLQFVDVWAARRRLVTAPVAPLWPQHVGARRLADAEAMFLQFQDHLAALIAQRPAGTVAATQHFRYLPAAGYLPTGPGGFKREIFFAGLDHEVVELDDAFLRAIVHDSLLTEPIDLDDPPAFLVHQVAASADWLLFTRAPRRVSPPAPPPAPSGEAEPGKSTVNLVVTVTLEGERRGEDTVVSAVALDAAGRRFVLHERTATKTTIVEGGRSRAVIHGRRVFDGDDLPAGAYGLKVQADGYYEASKLTAIKRGQQTRLSLTLLRRRKAGPPETKPEDKFGAEWITPGWFEKAYILEKRLRWPWPPETWGVIDPAPEMPEDVRDWAIDWGDEVRRAHPDAPIDPADVRFYVNPDHAPDAVPDAPYAYVVYGEGGAYAPVVLVGSDNSLAHDVPLEKGGLDGMTPSTAAKLATDGGLGDMELLAAGWTGLVADALGVSTRAGRALIGEARERVNRFRGAGELEIFSGVDESVRAGLEAIDIGSAVALANQEPATLQSGLEGHGVSISIGFVQRLIDEARAATPADTWSLGAAGLGFDERELAVLDALGVTSKGGLKARAGTAAGRAEVATALGRDQHAVAQITEHIDIAARASELSSERLAREPITRLGTLGGSSTRVLAGLGLATTGALAGANLGEVAAAFGGNVEQAKGAINGARERLSLGPI